MHFVSLLTAVLEEDDEGDDETEKFNYNFIVNSCP